MHSRILKDECVATYIAPIKQKKMHRELNLDTVAHLSTNQARRRLTSLIEANALTTRSVCEKR